MEGVSRQYSAVVLGCGRIGSRFSLEAPRPNGHSLSHAEAYIKNPETRLIGLADSDSRSLSESAAFWGIKNTTADAVGLCRSLSPDLVSICTPDQTHASILEELISLPNPPKGILVEKPLTLDLAEARRLEALVAKCNTRVAVNYSRRYSKFFREMSLALKQGALGQILGAQAVYGKGLFHNGSHLINLLRFWFGEPKSVSGTGRVWGPEGDPTISFRFESPSGFEVQALSIDEREVTCFELRVLTSRYRLEFTLGGQSWNFSEVKPNPSLKGYRNYYPADNFPIPVPDNPMAACLDNAISHLVDLVKSSDQDNWCSISEAVLDLKLLNQISKGH